MKLISDTVLSLIVSKLCTARADDGTFVIIEAPAEISFTIKCVFSDFFAGWGLEPIKRPSERARPFAVKSDIGSSGQRAYRLFATLERRDGVLGIILPDTGEWLSVEEAKVSPKCKNVIACDDEEGFVLWRSKLTLADIAALAAIKEGK